MLIFPTPPTVMPSVGDGTGASVVQVPCAYPDCAAVKVASAPAAMARSHFRRAQERSNMFLPPLGIHERQSEGMRAFPCPAGPGLCGGEPPVRVPASVRGAGPFLHTSLNGSDVRVEK